MKKHNVELLFVFLVIFMLFGVLFWNYVSKEQAEKKRQQEKATETLNSVEANNVSIIDEKLGSNIRITQDYLISYTSKKSSIWYSSNAKVKNIKSVDDNSVLILSNDKYELITNISTERLNVQVNDEVYFVGTINFIDGSIDLSKISTEEINYSSATKLEFSDLVTRIGKLKETHFQVSGYLENSNGKDKLFDSRDKAKKDANVGTYFTISWKDDEEHPTNQDVLLDCVIKDTYNLGECYVIEK